MKAKAAGELVALLDKLAAADSGDSISPGDVAEEIRAMRAERRSFAQEVSPDAP